MKFLSENLLFLCLYFVQCIAVNNKTNTAISSDYGRNIFPETHFGNSVHRDEKCNNAPGYVMGTCVLLDTCQSIKRILDENRPLKPETVQVLVEVHCGFQNKLPMVCCPDTVLLNTTNPSQIETINSAPDTDSSSTNHKNLPLLPLESCGYVSTDRIHLPPNIMQLTDVLPTMARLSYRRGSENSFRCGGSVITAQYILTAAHCVTNLPKGVQLQSVILNEFNVNTDPDCEDQSEVLRMRWCRQPVQRIAIDKVIPHPQYSASSYLHDIALIRLKQPVQHQEEAEIIALCLPVANVTLLSHLKSNWMKISGWGTRTNGTTTYTERLYGTMSPVELPSCRDQLKDKFKVTESHLCSVGTGVRDASVGDSGGPIMVYGAWGNDEPRLIQIGVQTFTSFPTSFNSTGRPNVYTSIPHHLTWILDTLKP